jgi:hypothetical protein
MLSERGGEVEGEHLPESLPEVLADDWDGCGGMSRAGSGGSSGANNGPSSGDNNWGRN